jgi:hypothetical protein
VDGGGVMGRGLEDGEVRGVVLVRRVRDRRRDSSRRRLRRASGLGFRTSKGKLGVYFEGVIGQRDIGLDASWMMMRDDRCQL